MIDNRWGAEGSGVRENLLGSIRLRGHIARRVARVYGSETPVACSHALNLKQLPGGCTGHIPQGGRSAQRAMLQPRIYDLK